MYASKAARCILTDSTALMLTLVIGLIINIVYHVPAPLTLLQILGIELLILVYPAAVLSREKNTQHHAHNHLRFEALTFGALAAVISYAAYLLCFAWHGLSPAHIDTSSQIYREASTTALLTLALGQLTNLLLVRAGGRGRIFGNALWRNRQLVRALAISLFLLLNLTYNPLLRSFFGTAALQPVDWLTALLGLTAYGGFRRLQHHTHRHSRHIVIELHREMQEL